MTDELHGHLPGRRIEYHDKLDSTNIRARQLGAAGAPHMTLVLANEQTAGRGRMTRKWVSPPGDSVLMTLLLRPPLPAYRAPELVFLSAVAACDAVNELVGEDVTKIKWPNDLVIGSKKISGTLLELATQGAMIDYAVDGIGINVFGTEYPPELPYAGSIESTTGRRIRRMDLVEKFLDHIDPLYDQWLREGFAPILDACRRRSATLGKRIRALCPDGEHIGTALDFDPSGALIVQTDSGETLTLTAGDVSVRGLMDYI
ncbi:MAG: biotin--[acetyl-CoA-carboxylase] ligase [Clostridia bacterium]|nr:biotin--[acetyl-CoA-carboxylase] ligase [Clostridia bacterium]